MKPHKSPDNLPKKHLFVTIQAVHNEVHKATDLW